MMRFIKIIFLLNAIFWGNMAMYIIVRGNPMLIINLLFVLEAVLYLFFYGTIPKNIKIINMFALLFTFGNMIFSITDQMGLLDVISFVLSTMAFASIIKLFAFRDK